MVSVLTTLIRNSNVTTVLTEQTARQKIMTLLLDLTSGVIDCTSIRHF